MFTPTPANTTVDGLPWGEIHDWSDMNWEDKAWHEHSIWGDDPHWLVPHMDGDTRHRVRAMP